MKKIYTRLEKTYVFPNPVNLRTLKPDSCVVRIIDKKPCIIPLGELKGKQVENGGRDDYSPVWGYQSDETKPYILINRQKKRPKFCDFCKDRLGGITGNCQNKNVKPEGCSFQPSEELKPFEINLNGWRQFRPIDLNRNTAFFKPRLDEISFDPKLVKTNKKIRHIARHLPEYQERKIEKYCFRCVYQGTCYLRSQKVAEHCMVTEEETIERSLRGIRGRFGSVDEYLKMLAYGGRKLMCKPRGYLQESEWRVSKPLSKTHYEILKPFNSCGGTKIARAVVERLVMPRAIPKANRGKVAALAWYYLDSWFARPLWISVKPGAIEVAHPVHGAYRFFRTETFTSFNEIHYFFNR